MPLRRKFLAFAIVGLVLIAVLAIGVFYLLTVPPPLERRLQARVEQALSEHYHRDVQMQNMHVTLVPFFRVTADAFVLPNQDADQPPFIAIKHFVAEANPLELLRTPIHITSLKLDGLVINIPPKSESPNGGSAKPKKIPTSRTSRLIAFTLTGRCYTSCRRIPIAIPWNSISASSL